MSQPAMLLLDQAAKVVARLATRLDRQLLWVDNESEGVLWECVALLWSAGFSLEIARGLLYAGTESADHYLGAALEQNVAGRGILYQALGLGIRVGVIDTEEELDSYQRLLDTRVVPPTEVVVAYLDYVRTADRMDEHFAERYSAIGRQLAAGLPSRRWSSYYWTTSDSYCIFGVLDPADHLRYQLADFLLHLIAIQLDIRAHSSHSDWMWHIGVVVASATILGDLLIPSREAAGAARLMKNSGSRDHGAIVVDAGVVTRAGAADLPDLLMANDGTDLRVRITRMERFLGAGDAYEVAERVDEGG